MADRKHTAFYQIDAAYITWDSFDPKRGRSAQGRTFALLRRRTGSQEEQEWAQSPCATWNVEVHPTSGASASD